MASNSRQRSGSSASRTSQRSTRSSRSSRNASARPASVKGRPSQSRSLRQPRGGQTPRTVRQQANTSRRQSGAGQSTPRSSRGGAGGSGEPLRSVSVSQVRDASRYRSRSQRRRFSTVLVVVAILLGVLGVGGFALANSSVFTISQVTVSGVSHITADELTELAGVSEGSTLLNVDADGIATRLTSNPWVQSVTVERVFPDTINLAITERTISAVVSVTVDSANTVERWALSSDGMWLTELPDQNSEEGQALATSIYDDAANALEITDIPYGSTPEAGSYCDNANIENALGIIDGMTTELADQVVSVSAASSDSTTLTLASGVEIAFGDSNDIRDKERVCLALLEEYAGQISYINVRTPSSPVWRSL